MKNILVLLLLISVLVISGANIETELAQARMRLGELLIGQGLANTEKEADQIALQDLTSQIVVTVSSSFEDSAKEVGVTVEEYCERVVKTYSEVELVGATKLATQVGKQYKVYRYITIENKNKIFNDRKSQIINLVVEGEIALAKENVTDALRNYYWALLLLKSHPDSKSIYWYFDKQQRLLQIALPAEMERILAGIQIELINTIAEEKANCSELVLQATSNGNRVSGLLVNYHDGYRWSQPTKWTDGIEYLSINNTTLSNQSQLTFKIDYTFANHAFIKEINSSMKNIPLIELNNAKKVVSLTKRQIKRNNQVKKNLFSFDKSVKDTNAKTVNKIITAISDKDLTSVRREFTTLGFQQFNALMGYGNAVIIPTKTTIKQVDIADTEVVRSIPMKFNFSTSNEDFTERVNFIFNEDGKVDGITFALSQQACADIVNKDFATDEEKIIIINFIEQYKTAYCLKDTEFIEKVFSHDALIIVGRMVKTEPDMITDMLYGQLNDTTVEYVKLNKKQYMERLIAQFKHKEFINVRFSDNSVDRVICENNKLFGIQIAQYYYSSNYSDFGYLFLMFDLNNIDNPKIMVRSWQPEKNADGSIIGMENFHWE